MGTTYSAAGSGYGYGQTANSYLNALMIDYADAWEEHIFTKIKLLKWIMKKGGGIAGKQQLRMVADTLPQSVGIGAFELAKLPNARHGSYFNPISSPKNVYSALQWSGEVRRLARKGRPYAFAAPRAMDLKHARQQMDLNLVIMGYLGSYQPLAKVKSYNGGTDVATLYGRNDRTSAAADFFKFGIHYLRKNKSIQYAATIAGDPTYYSAAALTGQPGSANEVYITALTASDIDNPTFTSSAAPSVDPNADEYVIPYMSRRNDVTQTGGLTNISDFAGMAGLAELITDSNLYGQLYELDRATYPTLSGLRIHANGALRNFSEMELMLAADRIADEGNGDSPQLVVSDKSVRREYIKEMRNSRRFPAVYTGGGYKGDGKLEIEAGEASLPWQTDRDCPPGMAWVIDPDTFMYLENSPLGPLDDGVPQRWVDREDAHIVYWHMSGQIVCTHPFANGTSEDYNYRVNVNL